MRGGAYTQVICISWAVLREKRMTDTHVGDTDLQAVISLKCRGAQAMRTPLDGKSLTELITFQRGLILYTKFDASFSFFQVSVRAMRFGPLAALIQAMILYCLSSFDNDLTFHNNTVDLAM
eukprot:TRINITY_DN24727_c0_g1_i1.p2 TRINITY_DN24727_c0_g1~~TRINITY_DN24727_c0_g1_i1.p2  ORF type:complete len:121 (+),score=11.58 TRINITY_DN24727_c0_g1_i1:429-791(+)